MEVKRIPPCPDYDIRGTEKWLEKMALEGYILCQGHAFQYGFAYFETGEPRRIRYRITPAKKVPQRLVSPNSYPEPPDEETLDFHSQFGWEYTTYRGQFWIFRCEDPDAPEMNTDPRVQAIALEAAEKRLREHFIWLLVYTLIVGSGHVYLFCGMLAQVGSYVHIPRLVLILLVIAAWLPGVMHIIRFRRELKRGFFPETGTTYSPVRTYAQSILRCVPLVVFFALTILLMPDYTHYGDSLTPEESAELPLVTVADLFPEAEVEYISSSNYIYHWDTDCAPDCTDLAEHFRLTFPDGTTVTGLWNLSRFETSFDWIAAGYARETRFLYLLRGGTEPLELFLEEADWCRAFHVDNPNRYRFAHDVILIQRDNVFLECSLLLFDQVPDGCTLEELGQFLLEWED